MRIKEGSNLNLQYGRRMKNQPCIASRCKSYHVSITDVSAAICVFGLYRRSRALKKSEKVALSLLNSKFRLSVQLNYNFITLKFYLLQMVNNHLEKMRDFFIKNGDFSYGVEARLAVLVDMDVHK